MVRRKLAVAAAGLVLAAAGCGSDSGSDGNVTLTYAVWNKDQVPALEQVIKKFEQSHDNIDVKIQLTPFDQYWTKLQAAASSGSAPDVFWMNGVNAHLYASNEMLLPLNEKIESEKVDLSAYPEALTKIYSMDGEQYGLPRDFDTVGLWYNKELFDKAKLSYPDDSWTWEDLRKAAAKLTDRDKKVYGVAAAMMNQENFYGTIAQAGGEVISADGKKSGYDDPATIEGLRFWTDLIKDGVSPSLQQMTDTPAHQLFESGKVAMYYGGSWRAIGFDKNEYTKDRVDVAPLPRGEKQAVLIHGLADVAYAKTEHPDEAWELVKFLGSEDAARIMGETGTVIPAYEGMQEAWTKSMPQYNLKTFIDAVDYSVPYPVSKNTAAWQADELELLRPAWAGEKDIDAAARELAAAMDEDLTKEAE